MANRDIAPPTSSYRRHALLAVLGLVLFLGFYFGLAGWFAYRAYALLRSIPQAHAAVPLGIAGAVSAFLAAFMIKGLLFIRRGEMEGRTEIQREAYPELFAFIESVADDAKAPRPHRVFLSMRVNAAVFYDLSLLNLLFPSKKNLEVGLGLVNALNVSEFRAVLAHEFGHFAQRTMAIGRWVYTVQQVAAHLVGRRDIFDTVLLGISRVDIRLAWIGWVLRTIVWSIRSMVETLFSLVVAAERALSREMEFQADAVAVALTGSDALVCALYKLPAADDALDGALDILGAEANSKRAVLDVFAVQSKVLQKTGHILSDADWGTLPSGFVQIAEYRLFKPQLAQPPRMWSSHPSSFEREEQAKKAYVPSVLDTASAWTLFPKADATRKEVTADVYVEGKRPEALATDAEIDATIAKTFERVSLDPRFRGAYLGRRIARGVSRAHKLLESPEKTEQPNDAPPLYPEELLETVKARRELLTERSVLQGIKAGALETPGGVLRYRGREHKRADLPALLTEVEADVAKATAVLEAHDARARATHQRIAQGLGKGWDQYHTPRWLPCCTLPSIVKPTSWMRTMHSRAHSPLQSPTAESPAKSAGC